MISKILLFVGLVPIIAFISIGCIGLMIDYAIPDIEKDVQKVALAMAWTITFGIICLWARFVFC